MADDSRRIDIGFQGGPVLPTRVKESTYQDLQKALSKDRGDRFFELETLDSKISIDLSQVVYVRIDNEEQRVGF